MSKTNLRGTYSYVLRVCPENMISSFGFKFKWPRKGLAEAHDWDPEPVCGHGLHGFLNGEGNAYSAGYDLKDPTLKWLVVKVRTSEIVDLQGKVKFPKGTVVFCGTQKEATEFLVQKIGKGFCIIGGTAVAGNYGKVLAGDYGTAIVLSNGIATAGNYGTAEAGSSGTAIAGRNGTATAGNYGTAIAGYYGVANVGNYGTAIADEFGHASAGLHSSITLSWYDYNQGGRVRQVTGNIGEKGLLPNVLYKLNDNHRFEKV